MPTFDPPPPPPPPAAAAAAASAASALSSSDKSLMQSQPQQGNQMMYLQSQSEYPSLQHPAAALNPPHPRTLPFNPHLPAINVNANLDQQQIHQIHADQTQLLNQQHLQQQSLLHQPHQAHQAQLHQHQQSQNLIKDDVSAASTPNSDSDNQKSALSRHVTAVISHFTANKDGYQRLINEIDDLLIVLSASANILFASSSILTFTDFSPSEVVGRPLMGLIHPDDASLLMDNISLTASQGLDWIIYARLKHKLGSHTLLEIRGKPYLDSKAVKYILLSGRPYTSKSTASIDSILSLRLENLRLKRQLELILVDRGMDPAEHHLLRDGMQVDLREMVALANGEDSNAAKKKKTASDELFCRSCGTTSSPEWRKGPLGPKTLCNACGLAFSKKQRKSRQQSLASGSGPNSSVSHPHPHHHHHSSVPNSTSTSESAALPHPMQGNLEWDDLDDEYEI